MRNVQRQPQRDSNLAYTAASGLVARLGTVLKAGLRYVRGKVVGYTMRTAKAIIPKHALL